MTASTGTPSEITDAARLAELIGEPAPKIRDKARPALQPADVAHIAASPLVVLATSDADGRCDASPKGDPPGFVRVLDPTRLAVPERPGNRRADGYRNVLSNPHVGLLFLVPGQGETLRVNGRARLLADPPYRAEMAVDGKPPVLVMEVDVEEVYFHCAKAFLRSRLWRPESWQPGAGPSSREIARTFWARGQPDEEQVERYATTTPELY